MAMSLCLLFRVYLKAFSQSFLPRPRSGRSRVTTTWIATPGPRSSGRTLRGFSVDGEVKKGVPKMGVSQYGWENSTKPYLYITKSSQIIWIPLVKSYGIETHHDHKPYKGFLKWGVTQNGWFLLGKILLKWMMTCGTPILGNLHNSRNYGGW